jgi:hypothetical protein
MTLTRKTHFRAADLRGVGRLAIDATLGLTRLVETMHHNIARAPGPLGKFSQEPTRGITASTPCSANWHPCSMPGWRRRPARARRCWRRSTACSATTLQKAKIRWRLPCSCAATAKR